MITFIEPFGQQFVFTPALVWVTIALSLAVVVAFYLFRSFALYKMAKNRDFNNAYLAFIPCVWLYIACKLIGNVRTFGSTFEKLALAFTIIFSVGQALNFFYQFILYFPVVGNYLSGKDLLCVISLTEEMHYQLIGSGYQRIANTNFYGVNIANPYANMGIVPTVNVILNVIYYITMFTDIAILVITILVYISLFRRYIPNHYVLFAVLSFLGLFSPLVFAVRKKPAVNYSDYVRSRYNMWYANGNPYGGQVNNGAPKAPSTPFEEFAERGEIDPGDPFDNFSENRKDNGDNDDFFN